MACPKVVHYISILTEPGSTEHTVCSQIGVGGDDGVWFQQRLQEQGINNDYTVKVVRAAQGEELPTVSAISDSECVVLGGTFSGVHDGRPWQIVLFSWLEAYRATGRPLLGICGGHQAMCVLLGGEVHRRPNGTCAASMDVQLTDPGWRHPLFLDSDIPHCLPFQFGNGDHVVTPPVNATILAYTDPSTDNSPAVALDYGGNWFSTQFHPESSVEFWYQILEEKLLSGNASSYRELGTGKQLIHNFLKLAFEEQ